ncbi:DNA polymerase II large subunit [Dirofilaria immitis]
MQYKFIKRSTTVSTFGVDVHDMCGGLETDPNERSRLAILVVTSTKPPTKRLTEKQKEKLSASCGHLHTQIDNEMEKKGDLDRIAPLRPVLSYSNRPRKWLSALYLDDERTITSRKNKNISRHRQSDWNLHDVPHVPIVSASHSARLHNRLSSAKVLQNSSGVKWTPNGTQDQSRPVKEQLWWGGH